MPKYFAYVEGKILGPFEAIEITQLPGFGSSLKVCPEGTLTWTAAGMVKDFVPILSSIHQAGTPPQPLSSDDLRECPFCAELIKVKAVKCRYCGSVLGEMPNPFAKQEARALISVDPPPAAVQPPVKIDDASRRLATMLFADLSGFTAMSRTKDPEEMHEIMNALLADLAGAVDRYGGKVDKYIGDCVMAVWGLAETREEDAFSATTSALSMMQRVKARAARLGIPLALHAGINTGEVIFGSVGGGSHVSRTVYGDAVNLACRLCDAAPKGTVFVSDSTWRRLGGRIEGTPRELSPKGVGKITAYELVPSLKTGTHVPHHVVQTYLSREAHVGQIADVIVALRAGKTLTSGMVVSGPGGVGKSRLCTHALQCHGAGLRILWGRSVPASPPPFAGVVSEWLSDLFGGSETSNVERFFMDRPELDSYRPDIEMVFSSGAESEEDSEEGPKKGLDRRLALFVSEVSKQEPLILSVSDVQWSDDFSIDVMSALAEAAATGRHRLLLLLDGRPSANVERLASAPGMERIRLDNFLPDEMREFLSAVVEGDLTASWVETLRRRTGGIVLNLVQVLDTLAGQGHLERIRGTNKWRLTKPMDEIPVPESLADLIWRRIDRLPSSEREILMAAGVCGKSFPRHMLAVASGWHEEEIDPCLAKLREDNFLIVTKHEVGFEHGSIQEAAHRMLLKGERNRIAQRILDHYGERIWHADLRHLADGLHKDAGRENALREFVAHDAQRLISIYRFDDARKLLSGIDARGWGTDTESIRARAMCLNAQSRLAEYEEEFDIAVEHSRMSLAIGRKIGEKTVMMLSLSRLARIAFQRKNLDEAKSHSSEALAFARELNNSEHTARELITLGLVEEKHRNFSAAVQYYEEAQTLGNWAEADPRRHVILLNSLGEAERRRGNLDAAFRHHKVEHEYALKKNDPRGIAYALFSMAEVARDNGDFDACLAVADVAREIRSQIGDKRGVSYVDRLLESLPSRQGPAGAHFPEVSVSLAALAAQLSSTK